MRRRGKAALASIALLVGAAALSPGARAGGAQDGEAGLLALNRGAYDEAIHLFTRALNARDLSQDDREFAYLSRGKAYLGKGDTTDALADLRQAVRLKPDDADAQAALNQAMGDQASVSGQPGTAPASGGRWGLLDAMAGHYYWYEIGGANASNSVFHAQWAAPEQTLSISIRAKNTLTGLGEYQFDDSTGKLLWAGMMGATTYYGTAEVTSSSLTLDTYFNDVPTKDSFTLAADGSIRDHEQQFKDGAWLDAGDVLLVEVSQETLEAQGLLKKKK